MFGKLILLFRPFGLVQARHTSSDSSCRMSGEKPLTLPVINTFLGSLQNLGNTLWLTSDQMINQLLLSSNRDS